MTRIRTRPSRRSASEPLEPRALTAVVLILNGNAFGATSPDSTTARFAAQLRAAGHRPVEVALGAFTPGQLTQLRRRVDRLAARGQDVAVAGLSAGGTLAARLAMDGAHLVAALDCYGPLDLSDWFAYHEAQGTPFSRSCLAVVAGNLRGSRKAIAALSGPADDADTPILAAFGERDQNVTIEVNQASARSTGANVTLMTYPGGHGVAPPSKVVAAFLELLDRVDSPSVPMPRPRRTLTSNANMALSREPDQETAIMAPKPLRPRLPLRTFARSEKSQVSS